MNAVDFEYDGQYLNDFGFIICDFNDTSGTNITSAGSNISFKKVSRYGGNIHSLTSTQYEECIEAVFDICKDPDVYDDLEISNDEFRDLMRWLNRKEFLKFRISDPDLDYDTCYYNASFNIEKIKVAEKLYGLRLTMETDKPFGYGLEQRMKWDFSEIKPSHVFNDMSDEIGFIYPSIVVTCKDSGNLEISNDLCNTTTRIKNCTNGEVLTMNAETQIISSSIESHKISEDFNYEFFCIGNTYDNRRNTITASLPCTLEIIYTPIIKDIP